jgi:hypothetical protein
LAAWRRLLIALGIGIVVIVCRFPRTSMVVAAALAITSALWKLGRVEGAPATVVTQWGAGNAIETPRRSAAFTQPSYRHPTLS